MKNLFFHELPTNQGKLTNQLRTTGSCMKIVAELEKSSCEHGKEQKFRQTPYPLSRRNPLCSLKKSTGDGSQQTVCKPVLTTWTSCSQTSLQTKGSQGYTQLNISFYTLALVLLRLVSLRACPAIFINHFGTTFVIFFSSFSAMENNLEY